MPEFGNSDETALSQVNLKAKKIDHVGDASCQLDHKTKAVNYREKSAFSYPCTLRVCLARSDPLSDPGRFDPGTGSDDDNVMIMASQVVLWQ